MTFKTLLPAMGLLSLLSGVSSAAPPVATEATTSASAAVADQELLDIQAVRKALGLYIEGGREGKSSIMRPAFHPQAIMYGDGAGTIQGGPIDRLFAGIDRSPPARDLHAEIASVEVHGLTASARVESDNWNGARYTDQFLLVKTAGGWQILTKVFHKH